MGLPEDLQKASDLLREAGSIIAKRLAADSGPADAGVGIRLACAVDFAHRARHDLEMSALRRPDSAVSTDASLPIVPNGFRKPD